MIQMNTLTQSLISNVYDLMGDMQINDVGHQQFIDSKEIYLKDKQQLLQQHQHQQQQQQHQWLYAQNRQQHHHQQQQQQQQQRQHTKQQQIQCQHRDFMPTSKQYQMDRSSSSSDTTSTNASPSPHNNNSMLSYDHLSQTKSISLSHDSKYHCNNNINNNSSNSNNLSLNLLNNRKQFNSLTSLNLTSNLQMQQMDVIQQQQQQQQHQHHHLLQVNLTHSNQVKSSIDNNNMNAMNTMNTNNNNNGSNNSSISSNHNVNGNTINHNNNNSNNINKSSNNGNNNDNSKQNNSNNNDATNMLNTTVSSVQQQQQQSTTTNSLTISNSTVVTNVASTTTEATSLTYHQHPHQQHKHQHVPGSTYKNCWCFGESVCSGIEIEIENNNNNHYLHGDSSYHMKILVPAVASGAIIGKGGETIASLQKDTGARVKMSKSHDFYPGTTERVCLITGTIEGIMSVLDFIMDKIREKPDLSNKILDSDSKQAQERDKQVKILVPNSTAGMIIGKGGAYIKQIKEESGSYVQISQKPKDISLQERCITIIGDKENNKNACKMILSKIVEDPQSGTCLNVSYADVSGPVANFNPTGSPYATNQNAINSSTASLNSTLGTTIGGAATAAGLLVNGTGINLSLNLGSPNPAPNLAVATQLLEHIKVALRGSGYTETATTEVCAALGVLAKYGVLGMGVGLSHANGAHTTLSSYLGVSALDQQAAAASAANAGNVFGAVGQVNLEQYNAAAAAVAAAAASRPQQSLDVATAAAQFDPFRHLGTAAVSAAQASTPVSLNNNSFGLSAATGAATTAPTLSAATAHSLGGLSKSPTPGDLSAKDTKNVEIPEVIVGAILGGTNFYYPY